MTIDKMHELFRELGQQMGMQQVRSILPDQIDRLINTSISDIVNQVVRENIGLKKDRANSDNEKISQIQALSTLYKTKLIWLSGDSQQVDFNTYGKIGILTNYKHSSATFTPFYVNAFPIDLLYLVDCNISYIKPNEGSGYAHGTGNKATISLNSQDEVQAWFPVRLIEESVLSNVLNDAILKCTFVSPILVVHNSTNTGDSCFDIYIDKYNKTGSIYTFIDGYVGFKLKWSYIAKPNVVKLDTTNSANNVNCNLPESMHVDVVKHAVDLFVTSVNRGTYSQQNQTNNNQ